MPKSSNLSNSVNSSKSPRFFCETCGLEVPRDANRCTGCGRYFSSVRCPACEFTGAEDLFDQGCPICGYSNVKDSPPEKSSRKAPMKKTGVPAGKLPLWVYILTAAVFTAVMAALLAAVS